MGVIAGKGTRGAVAASAAVFGALALLSVSIVTDGSPTTAAPLVLALLTLAATYRRLLAWNSLVTTLLLVILFIPMQRFVLPGSLPFQLEPFRLLAAFLFAGWLASL